MANALQLTILPMKAGDGDDVRGHIIASIIACMVLAFIAVALRFFSRRIKRASLLASDYLALTRLICAWVVSLVVIVEANIGLGVHIYRVPFENVRLILLTTFVGELFYSIGFTVIKLSIMALYRQLFPTRFMLISTTALAIFVILWGIALVLVTIFSCQPVNGFWDLDMHSKCIDSRLFFIGNAVPNILADLVLLLLPIRDIWKLQMSVQSRLAVSALFALGGFVIVASGLRIKFTLEISPDDLTWSYVGVGLWTAVEIDVAVLCSSLPTIRPVVVVALDSLKFSVRSIAKYRSTGLQSHNSRVSDARYGDSDYSKNGETRNGDFIPLV